MTPELTRNFEDAALICQAETQRLSARLRHSLLGCAIPYWQPERWQAGAPHNCYNFAVNNKRSIIAFPGTFAPQPVRFNRFFFNTDSLHEAVHEGALKDGLVYLGAHFHAAASAQELAPVALFMRDPQYLDFHWLALRRHGRELFWAHVPGAQAKATRLYKGEDIFTVAGNSGYHWFGGYYGVPAHKLGRPPKPSA